jgi:hypothetical protein
MPDGRQRYRGQRRQNLTLVPLRSPGFVLLIWLPLPAPPGESFDWDAPSSGVGGVVGPASGVALIQGRVDTTLGAPAVPEIAESAYEPENAGGRAEEASTSTVAPRAHSPTTPVTHTVTPIGPPSPRYAESCVAISRSRVQMTLAALLDMRGFDRLRGYASVSR